MSGRLRAYVGSRTTRERKARGDGITVFDVDPHTGALTQVQLVGDLVNPSFLALNRAGDRLYTVHGDMQEVSAFAVAADGRLALLNQVSCEGRNPVHLALDPTERWLVVSNHLSGTLAAIAVDASGALAGVTQLAKLPGEPGPHRLEQPFSKPHFNLFDPGGNVVIVPDKGLDRIFSYRLRDGSLVPAPEPWVQAREGAGPRQVAFHPALPLLYCVNELDSTVTTYRFEASTGALRPQQILPTLPSSFTGNSRAAAIAVNEAGTCVYASNRGHDSIAAFAIDPASGSLRFIAAAPSGGRTPRALALAPGGKDLYALNEDSDSIVRFAIDSSSGALLATDDRVACGSPVCMVFGPVRA